MNNKLSDLFRECAYGGNWQVAGIDTDYKFIENGSTLYCYFKGSDSPIDWFRNFDFKQKVYGLFKVHRGFYQAYKEVRNIILDKVYENDYKSIVVVGYSHGSALAQLCHQDLRYHFPSINTQTFAFESPRCLKVPKKLRPYWDNLTTIRNGSDLVTHLPPRIFDFDDLGKMVKIKGDTSLVKNHLLKCIKYHFPQCVLDGLIKREKEQEIEQSKCSTMESNESNKS